VNFSPSAQATSNSPATIRINQDKLARIIRSANPRDGRHETVHGAGTVSAWMNGPGDTRAIGASGLSQHAGDSPDADNPTGSPRRRRCADCRGWGWGCPRACCSRWTKLAHTQRYHMISSLCRELLVDLGYALRLVMSHPYRAVVKVTQIIFCTLAWPKDCQLSMAINRFVPRGRAGA
jgi:hypothetical protein